jgi:hypothetical protein
MNTVLMGKAIKLPDNQAITDARGLTAIHPIRITAAR